MVEVYHTTKKDQVIQRKGSKTEHPIFCDLLNIMTSALIRTSDGKKNSATETDVTRPSMTALDT